MAGLQSLKDCREKDGRERDWRDLAQAVTSETDSEKLIGLVEELCEALDRSKVSQHHSPGA